MTWLRSRCLTCSQRLTVEHAVLLRRLETSCGIGCCVFGWFTPCSSMATPSQCTLHVSDVWCTAGISPRVDTFLALHIRSTAALCLSQPASASVGLLYADDTQIYGSSRPAAVSHFHQQTSVYDVAYCQAEKMT